MSSVSAAKSMTNALSAAIVASDKLLRTKVWGETDSAVSWQGAFAVYGGNGTTASSAIVYEVEPGKRLAGTPMRLKRLSTSSREAASSISKTEPSTKSRGGDVHARL
jgi:hypothetical protein